MPRLPEVDAVVLAGGRARRLAGVDKPSLVVGGTSMLQRVLDAIAHVNRTVVVGPRRPVSRSVVWTREEPPGDGPVPALRAGLAHAQAEVVLLLAGDLPFLDRATVELLVQGVRGAGALLLDDGGREQWLCSAWRREALLDADWTCTRVGDLLRPLPAHWLRAVVTPGHPAPWTDCDTVEDLKHARQVLSRSR
jgi:molybdopterin-guanine dinucleotide biosynthesis protein A